jgi:hypothetical protein
MHTFKGKVCVIHYNSDMSGKLHIIKTDTEENFIIEAEDVLKFVAEYIRSNRITDLEVTKWQEFLK